MQSSKHIWTKQREEESALAAVGGIEGVQSLCEAENGDGDVGTA